MEDVGDIPVSLPTLTKINTEIDDLINDSVKSSLSTILEDVSQRYQLSFSELSDRYLKDFKLSDASDNNANTNCEKLISRQRKSKCEVEDSQRCIALILSGERCSRRRRQNSEFCGSHQNSKS